jgi:hypothetical protein
MISIALVEQDLFQEELPYSRNYSKILTLDIKRRTPCSEGENPGQQQAEP